MITGNIASDGISVTLTTGSLPSWITAGAQVSGYKNGSTVFTRVGYGTNFPYQGFLPANRIPSIASITDSTHFTLTTDPNTSQPFTNGSALTGVRFYIGQLWVDAMNKGVWQNCDSTPPTNSTLSLGDGFFGADGGASISQPPAALAALPPGTVGQTLWVYADTWWTLNAGQQRGAGASFIHNSLSIQYWTGSSPDASIDTQSFSRGGGASFAGSVVPETPPANYIWLLGGLWRDDNTLILVGGRVSTKPGFGIGITTTGDGALFVSNPRDFPDQWNITEIPYWGGEQISMAMSSNFVKDGSYYYAMSNNWGNAGGVAIVRYPASDIEATPPSMMNPEWWCGQEFGWVGTWAYDPAFPIPAQQYPILASDGYLLLPDSQGELVQDSNGDWLLIQGGQYQTPAGIRARNLGSSLATLTNVTSNGNSTFGDLLFYPPSDVSVSSGNAIWIYSCKAHPEQTWSGKTAGDMAISYANNNFGGSGPSPDNANYWVQLLRIAGL